MEEYCSLAWVLSSLPIPASAALSLLSEASV